MNDLFGGFDDILGDLRHEFLQRLEQSAPLLREARAALGRATDRAAARLRLSQEAHKLAGLGRTMGYAAISDEAFAVEAEATRPDPADDTLFDKIDALLVAIDTARAG